MQLTHLITLQMYVTSFFSTLYYVTWEIDIKDRHGTNIQSMKLEIYVSPRSPTPLLALWLETFILFNSQCALHFFGVIREKELFPNWRFSGCNLMWQSSNPKRDQFTRNMHSIVGLACFDLQLIRWKIYFSSHKKLNNKDWLFFKLRKEWLKVTYKVNWKIPL